MRLALAACLLALSIFGAAGADQINPAEGQRWDSGANQLAEGIAAYQRGDYSAAMRLLRLTPPLGPWVSFAHRIRKETSCPKQACLSPNPSIKAGQLQ
jgi:hypothetical protein